jgi:two-component system, LytTR family, sensor kinase
MQFKQILYWIFQFVGWGILFALSYASGSDESHLLQLVLLYLSTIGISHVYRLVFIRLSWPSLKIGKLVPRVVIGSLVTALIYLIIQLLVSFAYKNFKFDQDDLSLVPLVSGWLSLSIIFLLWNVFYFTYFFIEKSRNEELKELQMQAKLNEFELNNLKTQLNPHFIFNAMNSIRALIDENPPLARHAITQLSSILRTTLQMNKTRFVTMQEEVRLIREYLELEKIRFEERLQVEYEIDESISGNLVPPMMLQTLVENALKHGISKCKDGGTVRVVTLSTNGSVEVKIFNSGVFIPGSSRKGVGLSSTEQRLTILYGKEAKFDMYNQDGMVVTQVVFPKMKHEEELNSIH